MNSLIQITLLSWLILCVLLEITNSENELYSIGTEKEQEIAEFDYGPLTEGLLHFKLSFIDSLIELIQLVTLEDEKPFSDDEKYSRVFCTGSSHLCTLVDGKRDCNIKWARKPWATVTCTIKNSCIVTEKYGNDGKSISKLILYGDQPMLKAWGGAFLELDPFAADTGQYVDYRDLRYPLHVRFTYSACLCNSLNI